MFKKILVALDARDDCEPIFGQALALAQSTGASLELISVVPPTEDSYSSLASYGGIITDYPLAMGDAFWNLYQERFDASVRLGYNLLSGYANRAIAAGTPTEFVQTTGSPGRQICDRAKSNQADLIIVGSHGRNVLVEVLMGSVSNYVMHHAPCSVLVVHEKALKSLEAKMGTVGYRANLAHVV